MGFVIIAQYLKDYHDLCNTAGRTILVGIEDTSHYISGVDAPLATEEQI